MGDMSFRGTWTALVTPFEEGGERVDFAALSRHVEDQIASGISGLVPCGTTGEAPTLSAAEQLEVIRVVAQVARGRVPVMAGTGSNATATTIKASQAALEAGADAVMLVMPYYNKPSQDGMREHVLAVAASVDCPIVLYNIPGRSVVDLGVAATVQICERAPNVVGMKDASGNVIRCQELARALGDRLTILSGDDVLTLPMMVCGVRGVISVTSNVLPREVSAVTSRIPCRRRLRSRGSAKCTMRCACLFSPRVTRRAPRWPMSCVRSDTRRLVRRRPSPNHARTSEPKRP